MAQENPTMKKNKVDKVMEYILNTPENTNPAILKSMLEDLSSEGGGGESDFSTAQVTVKAPTYNNIGISLPHIENNMLTTMLVLYEESEEEEYTTTVTAVLYKGSLVIPSNFINTYSDLSGNISLYDEEKGFYLITGDCSFTVNANQ